MSESTIERKTDVDGTAAGQMTDDAQLPLAERVAAAFRRNPAVMTPFVAERLGVPEADVIRHLPDGASTEMNAGHWEQIIRDFEAFGDVYVIVNTGVVVLEAHGTFSEFSTTGPFFNVQNDSLDMHIRYGKLASIFAVTKPGHMDGVETLGFQFFTDEGISAFKVFLTFGGKPATDEQRQRYEAMIEKYKLA